MRTDRLLAAAFLIPFLTNVAAAGDGNRLTYLDDPANPYYVGRNFPKLTTPQWVGEDGVEAVVVLAIDDMRGYEKWEAFLRPIIERLKQIDGRAPVSIMTCTIDLERDGKHLEQWLKEGLSLEVHTIDHPCPLLKDGDFAKAKSTFDRCVDLLASVPGNRPVAFRMPCCDSLNTLSPRFFAEIFNKRTPRRPLTPSPSPPSGEGSAGGNFLQIDTSVFNVFTSNDPSLPRELVIDPDGTDKFLKYLPSDRTFVNTIEDYPYPYVIDRLCWEFPCVTPSDWSAQHRQKPNNPVTVEDWKAALDAAVVKQGTFNLVFHPHGWIKPEQIVELIDHAVAKHGRKVKFLTFREALDRINRNLLAGEPLRAANGQDNGVRLIDLDNDGFMDVVIGNETRRQTRHWLPRTGEWRAREFPVPLVDVAENGDRRDAGVRFGVLRPRGVASLVVRNERISVAWHFEPSLDSPGWYKSADALDDLEAAGEAVFTARAGRDRGVRLRDIDGGGQCELIVSNERQQSIFHWDEKERRFRHRWSYGLPAGTRVVDFAGHDAGLRFIDVNEDGHDDVIFSNEHDFSLHLFTSIADGWTERVIAGRRGDGQPDELPMIARDGTNNGAWFHSRHLWVQNEDTAKMKDLVDRRSFNDLVVAAPPTPRSPAAALRTLQPRPGFEVELVAAEPLVMDPIALAWGPDGKLWVVEMGDYPLGADGKGKHGGRVRFLEDTDGDGRYDRSTVFLDRIGFPTGVMPWRKGVLVTAAPEIFYAEDTDGDGRADVRRTLFTGFVEGNQQHRLNGLVWGLDNWIHCANGDSGGGIKAVDRLVGAASPPAPLPRSGERRVQIGGRDFRIRPDTGDIDPQTGQSQFGRSRDDWGNWFGSNNSNPMYQFVLADEYTRRNPHAAPPDPRVNVSVTPGSSPVYPLSRTLERFNDPHTANRFTSACSVIVYRDDLFGPAFAGNSFVSEPVHNLVHREIMSPRGVAFTSRRAPDELTSEFLASSDNWFRPTTIATGPDGALWIADMYRHVIEHPEWIPKEWQARLDLRAGDDKGRIYRVFPVGKRPRPIPRLDKLNTAELVAALDSPSGWQRDMIQMMLVWRLDEAAVPPLEKLAATSDSPLARLHALSTLDGLNALSDATILRAIADPHAGVRRHAARLAEDRLATNSQLADAALKLVSDSDPHVRMQLAYSLGQWNDVRAARALGQIALGDGADPYITAAVLSSATRNLAELLAVVLTPAGESNNSPRGAAEQPAAPPAELIERLVGLAIAEREFKAVINVLEVVGKPRDGRFANWQFAALAGVLEALKRVKSPADNSSGDLDSATAAVARHDHMFAAARQIATDSAALVTDRVLAVRLLGRGSSAEARAGDIETLGSLVAPQVPAELQEAAVASLDRSHDDRVPDVLVAGWKSHGPRIRAAVLDALVAREPWTNRLLDRIEGRELPVGELTAVHRQRLLTHSSAAVRDRATQLLGAPSDAARSDVIDEYRPVLTARGDAARGAAVFKRVCAACHRLGGVGTELGPDLAALTDRSPAALVTAILDPNRAVETKFVSYIAATKDGRTFTGMLAAETGNSVTLVAQEGKRETILRTDIEELQSAGKSLMPDGLERDLPPADMADLLAFLGSHGPPRKSFERNKPELVRPDPLRGELFLTAANAEIYGDTLVFEDKYANLGYWSSPNDHAVWMIEVDRPGRFAVSLDWACDDGAAGNTLVLETGDSRLVVKVPGTGVWEKYRKQRFGELTLVAGRQQLVARPAGPITGAMIDLRGIQLTPATKTK